MQFAVQFAECVRVTPDDDSRHVWQVYEYKGTEWVTQFVFLTLYVQSYHPTTFQNQKKIWIAEQKAQAFEKQQAELARARQGEAEALAAEGLTDAERARAQLKFMYEAPPSSVPAPPSTLMRRPNHRGDGDERDGQPGAANKQEEREARFPALKGAPTQGSYTNGIDVRLNPLGVRQRNVKCTRCHAWGHTSVDREVRCSA